MEKVRFDPKELEIVGTVERFGDRRPIPNFNSPISRRENYRLMATGQQPLWMVQASDLALFACACMPDSWPRGAVTTSEKFDPKERFGGKDMFGVEWEWQAENMGGSTVRPGHHPVKDLSHWEDYVTLPDPDSWDWAGSEEDTREYLAEDRVVRLCIHSGLFERLISFVGMEEALIAMIDEEEQEHVHRLFDYLCGVYEKIFANIRKYGFQIDAIFFQDDWGTQRAPFFSLETVREMLVPYLKRVVDAAHKYDFPFEFHSCGKNELLVPAMIEAGCDMWEGQDVNDKFMLMEKYGDKIIFGTAPDSISPDASEEEVRANVQAYLDKCKGKRTMATARHTAPESEYAIMYELSRKAFSE